MPAKTSRERSEEYYQFIEKFAQTDYEREKLLGKFYTDYDIARSMMQVLCKCCTYGSLPLEIRIIDPFCGDGRLILSLLDELLKKGMISHKKVFISIWDIDDNAVKAAESKITDFCNISQLEFQIDARKADAFIEYENCQGTYDFCVTNPPWTLLKPQKLFSKSNDDKKALAEYRNAIKQYDLFMKEEFALSQPASTFGKWGTNLARCGTELALKLTKRNGLCSIVSPASFLNDRVSNKLRSWVFENYMVVNVSYYPAELKLYGSADVSSVTIVVKAEKPSQSFSFRIYNDKETFKDRKIDADAFEYIKHSGYCIPLKTGIDSIQVMMHLAKLPSTEEFCNNADLRFTRELDETRVREKLISSGHIEFAKGYMVDRYTFTGSGLFLDEKIVPPPSSFMSKVVWRDVSRDSQARRMKATLLPPGYICGNSLGVIYGSEAALPYLKMLLAIMNSMVYEYQARSMLVSNHVSVGIVKRIRVPQPGIETGIIELVDKQLSGEDVEDDIELAVAQLYDLSEDEYRVILDSFRLDGKTEHKLLNSMTKSKCEGKGP